MSLVPLCPDCGLGSFLCDCPDMGSPVIPAPAYLSPPDNQPRNPVLAQLVADLTEVLKTPREPEDQARNVSQMLIALYRVEALP